MKTREQARELAAKCDRHSTKSIQGWLLILDTGEQQPCRITYGVYRHPNDGCQEFCLAEAQDGMYGMLESHGEDFTDRFESEAYGFGEIEIGKIQTARGLRYVFVIE